MCDIMTNKYKVFVIDRLDRYSYCDNYKSVVVAKDAVALPAKLVLIVFT